MYDHICMKCYSKRSGHCKDKIDNIIRDTILNRHRYSLNALSNEINLRDGIMMAAVITISESRRTGRVTSSVALSLIVPNNRHIWSTRRPYSSRFPSFNWLERTLRCVIINCEPFALYKKFIH